MKLLTNLRTMILMTIEIWTNRPVGLRIANFPPSRPNRHGGKWRMTMGFEFQLQIHLTYWMTMGFESRIMVPNRQNHRRGKWWMTMGAGSRITIPSHRDRHGGEYWMTIVLKFQLAVPSLEENQESRRMRLTMVKTMMT